MLDIYLIINSQIESIVTTFVGHYPTLEDEQEGQTKVYPYAEIKFPSVLINNSFSDNNLLQIDIWDNSGTDIRKIEGITNAIHKTLNKFHYNDENLDITIMRNNPYRLELPDTNINIIRRQLRYIVRVYYK